MPIRLNESRFSDTTPCLAWNLLYEERGIRHACEGDTFSLATKYIVNRSLWRADHHVQHRTCSTSTPTS
jgi:hypothetical protein